MPYFPETGYSQPYKCPGCGGWFIDHGMSCLVLHPPGTCCHKYETSVEPPKDAE